MPTMRTGFTAIAAATLLVGATTAVAAQSDASTASPASSAVTGVEHLRAQVDL